MREAVRTAEPPGERRKPESAQRPLTLIAGAFFAVHAVAGAFGGYWIDEVYMLAIGRYHPSWGYADQPPLAPMLAGGLEWAAPNAVLLPRLVAAALSTATVVLGALLAREFGGDRRTQVLAALAAATGIWVSLSAHWITPYAVEVPLWTLLTWLLVRWVRLDAAGRPDDRLLPVLGVVIGLAALAKVQVLLLCAALLGSAAVFGPRRLLRRPMFWGCVGIALAIAAPTLVWQALHGWPQLAMAHVVAAEAPWLSNGRQGMAIGSITTAGVLGTPLVLIGMWRLLRSPELRPYRFLAVAVLAMYVFYVITSGRPYYLIGAYGVLAAAGAVGIQRHREAGTRRNVRWVRWPLGIAAVVTALGMAGLSVVVPGDPAHPADRVFAEQVSGACGELPPQQRARTAVLGESYIVAAMLDAHADQFGYPLSASPHRGYGYFGPPPAEADSALLVARNPDRWRPYFADVREVRPGEFPVWLLSGREQPWPVIWDRLRSLA